MIRRAGADIDAGVVMRKRMVTAIAVERPPHVPDAEPVGMGGGPAG